MKAISEGINDLMLLGLDNFFSENVDNDIDGATDNATSHEILEFEDYVRILIPGGLIKVRKSRKKICCSGFFKKTNAGEILCTENCPQRSFFGRIQDAIICF